MPPKRAAVEEPEDTAPPSKKPSTEDAAAAIVKDASKITTSAKAAASGAESVPRTPTERRPRAANGLVLVHWNVGGLNGLLTGKSAVERKALLVNLVEKEQPDVLAISEHKLQQSKVEAAESPQPPGPSPSPCPERDRGLAPDPDREPDPNPKVEAAEKALVALLPGYTPHWAVCTAKNGYSGIVALVREGLTPSVELDTVCAP